MKEAFPFYPLCRYICSSHVIAQDMTIYLYILLIKVSANKNVIQNIDLYISKSYHKK